MPLRPAPDAQQASDGAPSWAGASCFGAPPAGVPLAPPPKPYTGGVCPTLKSGTNTIASSGSSREFVLVTPSKMDPADKLPVLFGWHWLKADAESFIENGELQKAVDQQRFIAVLPESKGDLDYFGQAELPWPFLTIHSDARMEEEYTFFDDMLACVSQQLPVNAQCVSAVGVSAGALFGAHLAAARSQWLASFISLSGGVGSTGLVNQWIRPAKPAARKLPMLILWGGPQDSCALLNFEAASLALEKQLTADGHFFVECIHNCRHSVPPVTPPPGKSPFAPVWEFLFAHPYWLPAGASPYAAGTKLPIPWCGVGHTAKPRKGACPATPGCPL